MQIPPHRRTLQEIRQEIARERAREQKVKDQVQFHLSQIMGRHRITQTQLAQASRLRPATVHALYHDRTGTISKYVLARVFMGLHKLTGKEYGVGDLLTFEKLVSDEEH